ncbi:hypothetical protein SAMN04488540_10543 [Ferrimonas sediminum]|uniref:Uncharacterized protein n=1 Tax=Ferrimonas sediminum TaxID=718193 RepID=A0A1G8R380_9GAMM|nr:hypothetical protein [Ferrimonas sediminum]SDJ11421.1 hypothetical protein SAMN04488540_10543 [Ferrimonas sediminum]
MQAKWWYVNPNLIDGYGSLLPPSTPMADGNQRYFRDANKLRLTVEGAWVRDDKDGWPKGSNDLVIASRFRIGKKPPITKLHLYRPDVPEKTWEPVAFHPEIFATNDFRESDGEIALQLNIYDEDGLRDDAQQQLNQALDGSTSAFALAFPVFAPYASLTAGVGRAMAALVDKLDEHDELIKGKIRLSVNKPANQPFDHLQPGLLVCFASSVDASSLLLGSDRKIYYQDQGTHKLYQEKSYCVIRIDRDGPSAPEFEINQSMATLLTEIELGKGSKGTQALVHLRETLEAYTTFKRLKRHNELQGKASRSEEENQLLDELKSDPKLAPYIGS